MHRIAFSIATLFAIASPAMAANENVITQSKALAGNVTPGDTPGFPITINTPGAYVLGSGIDVPAGQWGIVVNANGVDIDMSGYTLSGNGNADYGIVGGYNDTRVHDGIITSFRASGMYVRGQGWSIENMKIQRNSGHGIDASYTSLIEVRNSLLGWNGFSGIRVGDNAMVKDSIVLNNGLKGIDCLDDCHVEGNTVRGNGSNGIDLLSGIVVGNLISTNAGFGTTSTLRAGFANNIFTRNTSAPQRNGGTDMNPNACTSPVC